MTTTQQPATDPVDVVPGAASRAELLGAVHGATTELAEIEARRLVLVAALCDAYSGIDAPTPGVLHGEQLVMPGADGTPEVTEFFHLELALAIGCSPESAQTWVADTLNLRHRHPVLWEHAISARVPVWVARQVARSCLGLSFQQARRFDSAWAALMPGWGPGKTITHTETQVRLILDDEQGRQYARQQRSVQLRPGTTPGITHLEATMDAADAAHLDATLDRVADVLAQGGATAPRQVLRSEALGHLAHPDRARTLLSPSLLDSGAVVTPQGLVVDPHGEVHTPAAQECRHGVELVLHVQATDLAGGRGGVLETDQGLTLGATTRAHLDELLAADSTRVVVRPVVDLAAPVAVSCYQPSEEIRWRVLARDGRVLFPHSNRRAHGRGIDLDHTQPWPHGPTDTTNLAPLTRRIHRAKTHGGYRVTQTSPGVLHWQTPAGQQAWTSRHGTWHHPPPDTVINHPTKATERIHHTLTNTLNPPQH